MLRLDLRTDTKLTIASAGASLPFLQKYRASLEWLLDVADGAAPDHRAAIGRVRRALRELAAGGSGRVNTGDLKLAGAIMLAAIERDLGPVASRSPLRFPPLAVGLPSKLRSRGGRQQLAISLGGNGEWGLALGAGDWVPLFLRLQPELDWLLDVANSAAAQLKDPRQREAIERVRAAFRRLGAPTLTDMTTLIGRRDLLCVATLVLVALERDIGRVSARPARRFRADTLEESCVTAFSELIGMLTSNRV